MTDWLDLAQGLEAVDDRARKALASIVPVTVPKGHVMFRPGDEVCGFVVMLSGQVDVYLTGASGREILLYSVSPGETCVQTTLGILGEDDYSAEALAATDVEIAIIPKSLFMELLDGSSKFRMFVFHSFAQRLQSITQVLERVAFITIEERLAAALLERVDENGLVHCTHQELATAIGSVREVVSRRLELFAKKGLVTLERGNIHIAEARGLQRLIAVGST